MGKKILLNWTRLFLLVMTIGLSGMISQESWGQGAYEPKITSDKDDYLPGEIATISGSGWTQDQTVELHIEEDPYFGDAYFFESIPVDENGNWSVQIEILERHLGVAFTAYAIGHSTGATAYTYFTDGNIHFKTTGLPTGTSVTVQFAPGAQGNSSGSITFLAPGTSQNSTGVINTNSFTYTFPSQIVVGNSIYSLTGSSPASGFDPPQGNVVVDVTASYELCAPSMGI